jgi:hypothetical protein
MWGNTFSTKPFIGKPAASRASARRSSSSAAKNKKRVEVTDFINIVLETDAQAAARASEKLPRARVYLVSNVPKTEESPEAANGTNVTDSTANRVHPVRVPKTEELSEAGKAEAAEIEPEAEGKRPTSRQESGDVTDR